jgi:hypothetical protein
VGEASAAFTTPNDRKDWSTGRKTTGPVDCELPSPSVIVNFGA